MPVRVVPNACAVALLAVAALALVPSRAAAASSALSRAPYLTDVTAASVRVTVDRVLPRSGCPFTGLHPKLLLSAPEWSPLAAFSGAKRRGRTHGPAALPIDRLARA